MVRPCSIAIETSCRRGAIALGAADRLRAQRPLGPTGRHAADLLPELAGLLAEHGLAPADVDELYVSLGPGSFTGLRVGVTVARTWAQLCPELRLVAVPTAWAVAAGLEDLAWEHVAVLLSEKEQTAHASLFARNAAGQAIPVGDPAVGDPREMLAAWPRPILLAGEAMEFLRPPPEAGPGVAIAPPERNLPTAEGVWRVGRRLAERGEYLDYPRLLPIYPRRPEAIRLWEKRHGPGV